MSLALEVSAQYYQAGDYVAVAVYLVDGQITSSENVASGSVELRSEDTRRTFSDIDFDASHRNDDDYFTVLFIHPPQFMGIKIHVEVTDVNGLNYTRDVPVVFEAAPDTGLADSPASQIEAIGTIESGVSDQFDIFDARRAAALDLES